MEKLIILHGALGAADQMLPLVVVLSEKFEVHTFNFSGHGGKEFHPKGFSIATFAEELKEFIEANELQGAHLLGYSMGGYVALYLAAHQPDLMKKIVTLATKFHWTKESAAQEVKMLDPEKMQQKVPEYVQLLQNRHAPNDWKLLLQRTGMMMQEMGIDPPITTTMLKKITVPVLLLLGDRDKMISLEETRETFSQLLIAQMGMLPASTHPIESCNIDALCYLAQQFLLA